MLHIIWHIFILQCAILFKILLFWFNLANNQALSQKSALQEQTSSTAGKHTGKLENLY